MNVKVAVNLEKVGGALNEEGDYRVFNGVTGRTRCARVLPCKVIVRFR